MTGRKVSFLCDYTTHNGETKTTHATVEFMRSGGSVNITMQGGHCKVSTLVLSFRQHSKCPH